MSWREAWSRRGPGERRLILGIAGLVAGLVVIAFVWLPLERERARRVAELPALRGSLAQMERQAQEVKRLRAQPAPAPGAPAPLASLATNAGGLAGAQITVMDERRVRVTGADVGFTALLEWLRAAQATHRVRVESARVEGLPAPGRVRVEMVVTRG